MYISNAYIPHSFDSHWCFTLDTKYVLKRLVLFSKSHLFWLKVCCVYLHLSSLLKTGGSVRVKKAVIKPYISCDSIVVNQLGKYDNSREINNIKPHILPGLVLEA